MEEVNNHTEEEVNEQIEIPDLTSDIYNLSAALNCLSEIDKELMDKIEQRRFEKMKEKIFNAPAEACEML